MTPEKVAQRLRRGGVCISLSASLALAGCAAIAPLPGPNEQFLKAHYILAHEDGFALRTDKDLLLHERLSKDQARVDIQERIVAGIDAHALRLWPRLGEKGNGERAEGEPLQLVLYAHGGLNGYGDDFGRMRTLLATPADCEPGQPPSRLFASAACPNARSRYYPVFVNWNSEVWDSIRDDLFFIRFGERVKGWEYLLTLTAPLVATARVTEAIFSSVNGFAANVRTFKDSKPGFWDWVEGGATLLPRLLITPVVKAFGTSAWQIMNRRAGLLAARDLADGREGVVWSLLSELDLRLDEAEGQIWWTIPSRSDAKVPIEITLVGHSMGAIVLNRMLVASRELKTLLPVKRVVYLGAAASIKDAEAVKLLDRGNQAVRFTSFMLYRGDESRERSFYGLAPRGTLLIWVDDFFEPVVEAADKRYGGARSYERFLGGSGGVRGICEWDSNAKVRPRSHGALDAPEFLEAVLRHIDEGRGVFVPGAVALETTRAKCVEAAHGDSRLGEPREAVVQGLSYPGTELWGPTIRSMSWSFATTRAEQDQGP